MRPHPTRYVARTPLAAAACALALAGCGSSVSTSSFKGEEGEVAQAVANLQSDTSSQNQAKVCGNDLARAVVERLNLAPGGCEKAVKNQQAEIDPGLEVNVESVHLGGPSAPRLASAWVRSIVEGKKRSSTLFFTKEGGKWKLAGAVIRQARP